MNLNEGITEEVLRCRGLLIEYERIDKPGRFAVGMMKGLIKDAETARDAGDIVQMVVLLQEMKECA